GRFEIKGSPGIGAKLRQNILWRAPEIIQRVLKISEVNVEGQRRLLFRIESVQSLGRQENLHDVVIGMNAADLFDERMWNQAVLQGIAVTMKLADRSRQPIIPRKTVGHKEKFLATRSI